MSINWRLASRLSVITLAILVVVFIAILQQQRNNAATSGVGGTTEANPTGLQGTLLNGKAAPNFQLQDQMGKEVSLAQFKGKPVVLTFLFTNCPDVCPLTAQKLNQAMQKLGSDSNNIGVLAVSTDPKRDTVEAALDFSKKHSMQDYWHFLVGSQETLAPVWSNYSIYARTGEGTIDHTLALYVIDKEGRERVYMGDDFTPDQLVKNLQILLKE